MDNDLIIVGGGPVGTTVASLTASKMHTILLEEHPVMADPTNSVHWPGQPASGRDGGSKEYRVELALGVPPSFSRKKGP